MKTVREWLAAEVKDRAICIASRTKKALSDRNVPLLEQAGIEHVMVLKDPEGEATEPGIRLATMHRMKGLEFSRVLLAQVQKGKMPLPAYGVAREDTARKEEHELQERCLLYVACTRARDELVVCGYGEGSRFLTPS